MFKGSVWSALLCNASSSLPPWKPQTARRIVLARHPKARLELSHTHEHPGSPGEGSGSLEMLSGGRWETMLSKLQEHAPQLPKDAPKQSHGHRFVPPRIGSPVERIASTSDKRRCQRRWPWARTLSPGVVWPPRPNGDSWPRWGGLPEGGALLLHSCTPLQQLSVFVLVGT